MPELNNNDYSSFIKSVRDGSEGDTESASFIAHKITESENVEMPILSHLNNYLFDIASYTTTYRKPKNYGECLIYQDGKIFIEYDTYGRNYRVVLHLNDKEESVYSACGEKYIHHYRHGAWEKYVKEILFPISQAAKYLYEAKKESEKLIQLERNFGRVNDSEIFS